jgi:protein-disulfide isomerase
LRDAAFCRSLLFIAVFLKATIVYCDSRLIRAVQRRLGMRLGKWVFLLLGVSIGISACVVDTVGLSDTTPSLERAGEWETETEKTRTFQGSVDTAVASTLTAIPSNTAVPTQTPELTDTIAPSENETPTGGTPSAAPPDRYDIEIEGQPSMGPIDAPVVIVEFSDFSCGYCQRWHLETFQRLMDAYPGQIRFVYRDFPILFEESFNAAVAAQCAHEQGAFWGFHEALFTRTEAKGLETYLLFAQELGLDIQKFQGCMDSGQAANEVISDARFASSLGIGGTPTFFINGIPMIGAQPLENFTSIIDQELGE